MSVKALAPIQYPVMTTTQRDALPAALRPAGSVIWNSTTGELEVYTGSAWQALGATPSGTWAEMPTSAVVDSLFLLSDSWAGDGGVVQAAAVSVLMKFTNTDSTQPWEAADGTHPQLVNWASPAALTPASGFNDRDTFTFPAKATVRCSVEASVASSTSHAAGIAMATTAGGNDIVSATAAGTAFATDGTASSDTTFAAGAKLHLVVYGGAPAADKIINLHHYAKIVRMAGQT